MSEEPSRQALIDQISELHGEVLRLGRVKDELEWTEDALKRRTRVLNERIKELECVYDVARALRADGPLEQKLQTIADRLPAAWQFPRLAQARVSVAGRDFRSPARGDAAIKLEAPIVDASGRRVGSVELAYAKSEAFLPEESALLQVVAQLVGMIA